MKESQALTVQSAPARRCLRSPIPEIAFAAGLIESAVTAHLLGQRQMAEQLIKMADMAEIREWVESVWGKGSPNVQYRPVSGESGVRETEQRVVQRMPSMAERRLLLKRDGYHCRFCGIPVIRKEVRAMLHNLYPAALPWGSTNATQHAAFQAMWAQYDHILPHARGGGNDLENIVITCAPCNFGRMNHTLAEVGLEDPRTREPLRSNWDGLERLLEQSSATARQFDDDSGAEVNGKIIELREGPVDRRREHFELSVDSAGNGPDNRLSAALIGPPIAGIVKVQLLSDPELQAEKVERVWKELRFYLLELNEQDPWLYAQYHCGTAANVYSDVHWEFFDPSVSGEPE